MVFENPAALWLMLLLFLIAAVGFLGWKIKKEIIKIWLDEKKARTSQISKYILAVLLVTLLIAVISAPKVPFSLPISTEKQGLIVFMADVSGSMAAKKDLDSSDRLERTKQMIQVIINAFPEATFYPFHFTNIARSITPPLTKEDFPYLQRSIERVLDVYSAPGKDSSLGTPILQVVNKIAKEDKAKIIVLFSDGEFFNDWLGKAEDTNLNLAVSKAAQENIKIVTVGVGEREGARVPLYNEKGEFTGKFAEYGGKVFTTKLEEKTLKLVASKTQGEYFFEDDFEGVTAFLRKNMESGSGKQENGYQDIGYLLLIPAAVLWIVFARLYLK